ncbi:MAG: hypothetical protein FJY97_19160 [candidate division Zixibacteria bacterium]|nr:hypothetical protein [candidate division Zixibacteria bacterium]
MSEHVKVEATFKVNPDSLDMLEKIKTQYRLPDTSKALRVLLDYCAQDGNWDEIFKKIRCHRCG